MRALLRRRVGPWDYGSDGRAPSRPPTAGCSTWWMRFEAQSPRRRAARRGCSRPRVASTSANTFLTSGPSLVLHASTSMCCRPRLPVACRPTARRPDETIVTAASLELLPSDDLIDEVEEFIVGTRSGGRREVATLVVTDVVGSTDAVARSGDASWRDLLIAHRESVRHSLARFSGREIVTTGDGFFTSFSLPSSALRFAEEVVADASRTRASSSTSGSMPAKSLIRDADVIGIAAHVVARVAAAAGSGEVFVTDTVRVFVAGSHVAIPSRRATTRSRASPAHGRYSGWSTARTPVRPRDN